MENDGWTGIAFVNTDTSNASVILRAYDESGNLLAENLLPPVNPGEKVVDLTSQLFAGANLASARYFEFVSDKPVIGFSVSRSDDGLKLDGLMASSRYLRTTTDKVR